MRQSEILVLLVACLLFAIGMPSPASRDTGATVVAQRQEQEEREEEVIDFLAPEEEVYEVRLKAKNDDQNKIIDALWLQKAASVAMDAGIPYFNVKNQKSKNEVDPRTKKSLKVVEGEIVLDNDPMQSDYNAQEILELTRPSL